MAARVFANARPNSLGRTSWHPGLQRRGAGRWGMLMAGPISRELLWDCSEDAAPHVPSSDERCGVAASPPSGDWLERLVKTIEGEIVPRLMLAHRAEARSQAPPASDRAGPAPEVASFVQYLLRTADVDVLARYVESLRSRGATLDAIYLDLFAPAARRLGQMWEDDLCGFSEVTIGLCRLQQLVHRLSLAVIEAEHPADGGPRILLALSSREQHTFGLSVVGELFRAAGWDIAFELSGSARELGLRVRTEPFDVVGLSIGSESRLRAATALLRIVRRASCNPRIGLFLGGPLCVTRPALVAELGADGIAQDGRTAVELATAYLARLAPARNAAPDRT
jgi:methanogenic corrinoid protein MtbC1